MAKAGKKGELVDTSELARRAGLDRNLVRGKLEGKGVQPREKTGNETLYDADEALAALQAEGAAGLRKAQTAKTAAEAERVKLKLDRERGELVSVQDVRADTQAIATEIRQHFLTRASVLAPQLRGQKVARIEEILREDAERFFSNLRAEFEGYLSEASEG